MAVFGHLPRAHLAPYVAAQLVGSVAASFAARAVHGAVNSGGAVIATVPTVGAAEAFGVEFVGAFLLVFVIAALCHQPQSSCTVSINLALLISVFFFHNECIRNLQGVDGDVDESGEDAGDGDRHRHVH
ncbi:hypothetical protein E2562_031584 [Oryza meyeriana var. granulata]|uniref:Aquaporin n=1 Tax=Oryza meyeriana var. granulata TaxID=110450 RepID=A0A6G1CJQ5_9ORYZ|nr:hypothetical protein E2562_031584 [Oryza meyeriana var. granulata]